MKIFNTLTHMMWIVSTASGKLSGESSINCEPLCYDTEELRLQERQHAFLGKDLIFGFRAFNRNFTLHLKMGKLLESPNLILHHKGTSRRPDLSFMFIGRDTEYPGSVVRASISNGTFQGIIKLSRTLIYHAVPSEWVKQEPVHSQCQSVIFAEHNHQWTHTFTTEFDGSRVNTDAEDRHLLLPNVRKARSIPRQEGELNPKHTCNLKLTTDHTVWRHMMHLTQSEERSRNNIIFMLKNHVSELNDVFANTVFTLHKGTPQETNMSGINIEIETVEIMTEEDCANSSHSFSHKDICSENLLAKTLLENYANREQSSDDDGVYNGEDYEDIYNQESDEMAPCLSFLFTARVMYDENGGSLLGLAYPAVTDNPQGICFKEANNGFITLFKYTNTSFLPPSVTQLVFTHEVAHSFGAQHDNEKLCADYKLGEEPVNGYYLMHSVVQPGLKSNNKKLSSCSIDFISRTLSNTKYTKCFTEKEVAICGNSIIEEGEECDCGTECRQDNCCYGKGENANNPGLDCTLKPGAYCSPSQGPCCNGTSCQVINIKSQFVCQKERQCIDEIYCHGAAYGAVFPPPKNLHERDGILCNINGRMCEGGSCNASVCKLIGWRECQTENVTPKMTDMENKNLIFVSCKKSKDSPCLNISDDENVQLYQELQTLLLNISHLLKAKPVALQLPYGTHYNKITGYFEFRKYQGSKTDTSLARFKNGVVSGHCLMKTEQLAKDYWWFVIIGGLASVMVMYMYLRYRICAKHKYGKSKDSYKIKNFIGLETLGLLEAQDNRNNNTNATVNEMCEVDSKQQQSTIDMDVL